MKKYKVLSTKKLDPSLIEQANENDIEIIEQEMISVTPVVSEDTMKQVLYWADQTGVHAVFTSVNAVNAVQNYLQQVNVSKLAWKVFCISGRTKAALQTLVDEEQIVATAAYGNDLAERIIEQQVKEVVFFCGNKRRQELPSMLQSAGVIVNEIMVYETSLTPSVVENDFDAILFFSPTAVESFFSANVPKENTVCFAIGTTTSGSLAEFTSNKIEVSEDTSQESMLASVLSHFKNPVA
jgi:uroporphyrinogen-III synthase